jgi:hypothetical protein
MNQCEEFFEQYSTTLFGRFLSDFDVKVIIKVLIYDSSIVKVKGIHLVSLVFLTRLDDGIIDLLEIAELGVVHSAVEKNI